MPTRLYEYLERNTNHLSEIRTPDGSVGRISDDQQSRLQVLLAQRGEIEDLASVEPQRMEFGEMQWDDEYVRLSRLSPDIAEKVWRALPNCRFKRAQELFCDPANYIVPSFRVEGNRAEFLGVSRSDFTEMSVKPCLFSVERISEVMMEKLHLCDFAEDKGKPLERLKKIQDNIPRLKLIMDSSVQIEEKNLRILIVHEPKPHIRDLYRGAGDIPEEALGKILYSREKTGADVAEEKQVGVYSGYDAYGRTSRVTRGHRKEVSDLTNIDHALQVTNGELNQQGHGAEVREKAKTVLGETRDKLKNVLNEKKKAARDLVGSVADLRDKRGKENPTVAMTKMVAARNRLDDRQKEIPDKGTFNYRDALALQRMLKKQEESLITFHTQVMLTERFPDAPVDVRHLHGVTIAPLATYARRLEGKGAAFNQARNDRDVQGVQLLRVRMHVLGKFRSVHTCIARIEQFMRDNEVVPAEHLNELLLQLQRFFQGRQVDRDYIDEEYRPTFEQVESSLVGLQEYLEGHRGQSLDTDQQEYFKELLDAVNIEELARTLP